MKSKPTLFCRVRITPEALDQMHNLEPHELDQLMHLGDAISIALYVQHLDAIVMCPGIAEFWIMDKAWKRSNPPKSRPRVSVIPKRTLAAGKVACSKSEMAGAR